MAELPPDICSSCSKFRGKRERGKMVEATRYKKRLWVRWKCSNPQCGYVWCSSYDAPESSEGYCKKCHKLGKLINGNLHDGVFTLNLKCPQCDAKWTLSVHSHPSLL